MKAKESARMMGMLSGGTAHISVPSPRPMAWWYCVRVNRYLDEVLFQSRRHPLWLEEEVPYHAW